MTDSYKKLKEGFLRTGLLGLSCGMFAGMLDCFPQNELLFSCRAVCAGLLLWMTVCAWLSLHAKCGLHASLTVLSFLTPMLSGYCLWARLTGEYLNGYLIAFWAALLLPSAILAWVLRANRRKAWLRVLAYSGTLLAFALDFTSVADGMPLALLAEIVLLVLLLRMLYAQKPQESMNSEPARYSAFC